MKKLFKFFATVASVAAVVGGAYLVYKNFFAKEEDDFDFDDSFDDEDDADSREYVSINITTDEEDTEEAADTDVTEEVDAE